MQQRRQPVSEADVHHASTNPCDTAPSVFRIRLGYPKFCLAQRIVSPLVDQEENAEPTPALQCRPHSDRPLFAYLLGWADPAKRSWGRLTPQKWLFVRCPARLACG